MAARVIARAQTDGAERTWTGIVPTGPGLWFSSQQPPAPPLLPGWRRVTPWLMSAPDQFRPAPPPAVDSPQLHTALAEVRQIAERRTPEHLRLAAFWADGVGTYTPPGHWNAIAAELIVQHRRSELEAARTLAFMNMAIMDAGISCWDAKYVYWFPRPSQVEAQITTPIGLPNFPSYTSGHAAFSGAAADVLGVFFPAYRDTLRAMAEEAAMSRVYGGIHYRFDSEAGLEAGRAIAHLAVQRAQAD